jgi:hypothetical protein
LKTFFVLVASEKWLSFADYETVRATGVSAGLDVYVGACWYNGNQFIAQIEVNAKRSSISQNGQIIIIARFDCAYLVNELNRYQWEFKGSGIMREMKNAVSLAGWSVGRGNTTGLPMRVDKVSRTLTQVMQYPNGGVLINLTAFDILFDCLTCCWCET